MLNQTPILGNEGFSTAIEVAIDRFEIHWQEIGAPFVDDYLQDVGPYRSQLLQELIAIDLEYRLKQGEQVRVEEYLRRYPELAKEDGYCLQLVTQEFLLRQQANPELQFEEYKLRFPAFEPEIRRIVGAM